MLVRFLTCFLILAAVAVQRNESLLGHDVAAPAPSTADSVQPVRVENGVTIINTTTIASDIKGYGGPVPLEIRISDGRIASITALRNAESPAFFSKVDEQLIPKWIGVKVSDVQANQVDAVTGATLSSNAVNATIRKAIAYADENAATAEVTKSRFAEDFSVKKIAVLIVILCAAILPLFIKNQRYRYIQLGANVLVLGVWSGTFLSYEVFVNYIANGMNVWHSLAWLLMLVVAFIYPYFGRRSHYCTWVCPLGSLQELAGRCIRYKIPISARVVKILTRFQEWLWFALMLVMIAGIWFEWMNYELFTAFIVEQAAPGVLIAAIVLVLLSVVVMRPYCRFICPTGCLFQITQNPEK